MLYVENLKDSLNSILSVVDTNSDNTAIDSTATNNTKDYSLAVIDNNIDQTTNCLALTVRDNYHMVVIKNAFKKSFRISWKVALSIFVINFLNMFL